MRRIKAGSLLKLILLSSSMIFGPLCTFFGVLALFGARTVRISGECVTGMKGLIAALIMAPVFTLTFGLIAWVAAYLGIRIFGYIRPLEIEYVPADNGQASPLPQPPLLPSQDPPTA